MELKEIKNKIAESPAKEWFKNVEAEIKYRGFDEPLKFKGFINIFKYIQKQSIGWQSISEDLPTEFITSKGHFTNILNSISNFLTSYSHQSEGYLTSQWRTIGNSINNPHQNVLPYESAQIKYLLELHNYDIAVFKGAFNFFTGSYSINSKEQFVGFIYAYEFSEKRKSNLAKRIKSERTSIERLKSELENSLTESDAQLVDHLKNASDKYKEYSLAIDSFKEEKEGLFNDWFSKSKKDFRDFSQKSKQDIATLEKTYEELLRLKKPAEYWKLRADKLKKEGWKSLRWLIIMIIIGCIPLYFLLWLTPGGMIESFSKDSTSAIRWSIIFITFISFLVFGIRILNRVSFSSFHLARDAEEREQLTYVYLSLIKDANISDAEKQLIMQSLFSRADTGLLKEDSSPTMPNDFMGKIIGK